MSIAARIRIQDVRLLADLGVGAYRFSMGSTFKLFTLLQWLVPDQLMGRVFTSDESLLTLAVAAGSLAAPGLIALFGIRGALIACGYPKLAGCR